jgi:tRNA A37 threonylcarbamoyladenosine dehydratase
MVTPMHMKVTPENIEGFHLEKFDYVIDAIDDIGGKMAIIKRSKEVNSPVISSMGTGNKMRGEAFRIADISKTHTCPLAKRIRKECRVLEIQDLKVLFSIEEPTRAEEPCETKMSPASISFIPSVAGLLIAGEVIRDILTINV